MARMARTAKQRAASRRNLISARRHKHHEPTLFGTAGRFALGMVGGVTKTKAISDFIEGKGTPSQIRAKKKARGEKRKAKIAKRNALAAMVKK